VHKKGGIISLGCDRFGLQRSPLAYGRLKLIATAFIATAFIATASIATAFIATALYRYGLYRHGVLSPRRCARRAQFRDPVIIRPE